MTAGVRGSVRIKGVGVGRCRGSRVWLARVARRFFADSRVNAPRSEWRLWGRARVGGGRSMALLVCESLALQEASRALTEAFVPLQRKGLPFASSWAQSKDLGSSVCDPLKLVELKKLNTTEIKTLITLQA